MRNCSSRLIRKLIFQDIYILDEEEGLRLARKLPWEHHVSDEGRSKGSVEDSFE